MSIMQSTTKKIGERYETGLLWKHDKVQLPPSRGMALKRLKCLEATFMKNPEVKDRVVKLLKDYEDKGYIRRLTKDELLIPHEREWYLPMFIVQNPNKPDKIRPVYDAAATVNDVSLNSVLLKGPDLVPSLLGILLRFREGAFAATGDIKEMFPQIKMIQEDQHSQRILWKNPENNKIDTYVVQVVSFGATCSPSSAQYVENLNAQQFTTEHPKAVENILNNHYVDDMLASENSEDELISIAKDVKMIHKTGGFEIRNWVSNSRKFEEVMNGCTAKPDEMNLNIEDKLEKVLGMFWNPREDEFTYSLKFLKRTSEVLQGKQILTKREVLRILASLFDPLGLLSQYLSFLKVMFQDIWRSGIGWDELINTEHQERWQTWLKILPSVTELKIPRCVYPSVSDWPIKDTQLHTFVDASDKNCVAWTCIRTEDEGGNVHCALIGTKTKVAPIKITSMPRLELTAALIGARLSKSIQESLRTEFNKVVNWTDSKTVLSWVRSSSKSVKGQYVSFRVSEIQDISDIATWRYVPSKLNVADDATKWRAKLSLSIKDRWYTGPRFLYLAEEQWPEDVDSKESETEPSELVNINVTRTDTVIPFKRYPTWQRLMRVIARMRRWLRPTKNEQQTSQADFMTSEELKEAQLVIIRIVQQDSYPEELRLLKGGQTVPRASSIYQLSPVLDTLGIIKMDSRTPIQPIILPVRHEATELLIKMYHRKFRHQNHETVVNEMRQAYHIPRLRQALKKIRNDCNMCKLLNTKPMPPKMASLPRARLRAFEPPFSHTGIDCMGPFEVVVGRHKEKRWVCLTVRAVHVEILHTMNHQSFIMAYRNFTNRRGKPQVVYCDNGTNFTKAEKVLREHRDLMITEEFTEELQEPDTEWRFNPPDAPHMGGAWERLVRSIKTAFYSCNPSRNIDDETFRSYMTEAENIVNARPLTYVPLEDENEEALIPNHFLRLGVRSGEKIGYFDDDDKFLREKWLLVQQLANKFWKRWVAEYMPDLNRRSKWYEKVERYKLEI